MQIFFENIFKLRSAAGTGIEESGICAAAERVRSAAAAIACEVCETEKYKYRQDYVDRTFILICI